MIFLQGEGFSLFELLAEADFVVLTVLIILLLASAMSWGVIFEKLFTLPAAMKSSKQFENEFWDGRADLKSAGDGNPAANVFAAASREWDGLNGPSLTPTAADAMVARADLAMQATVDKEVAKAGKWTGFLATVASASPFIGLLGTVWGIMNAFIEIGAKNDTSLATVAGPIAEALFATALGLVAAIPATIFYNKFTGDLNRFADQLDSFSKLVQGHLSRKAYEWVDSGAKGK